MTNDIRLDLRYVSSNLYVLILPMFEIFLIASSRSTIESVVDARIVRLDADIVANRCRVLVIRFIRIQIFLTECRNGSHR